PAGRGSSRPHRLAPGRRRRPCVLPNLPPHGWPRVPLAVQVVVGDALEERLQGERLVGKRSDDQLTLDERQLDGGVGAEAGLRGERLGDAQGKAVAPLLDARLHATLLVSTMNIRWRRASVNAGLRLAAITLPSRATLQPADRSTFRWRGTSPRSPPDTG